ncbi:MAG: hypothetical protein HYU02_04795 [Thaumarchaeota archaeon]|nr:hypothetical protein [Nitrososphaerota archaeon]
MARKMARKGGCVIADTRFVKPTSVNDAPIILGNETEKSWRGDSSQFGDSGKGRYCIGT